MIAHIAYQNKENSQPVDPDIIGLETRIELPEGYNEKSTEDAIRILSNSIKVIRPDIGIASLSIEVTLDEVAELLENTPEFALFKIRQSYHKDNLLRTGVLNGNEEYIRVIKGSNITYTVFYKDAKPLRFEDGSRVTCMDSQGRLLKQKINKMMENLHITYKTNKL